MRRHGGHYGGDSGGGVHHAYGSAADQAQQRSSKSGSVTEKEERHRSQWRWERDAAQSKLAQTAMSPTEKPFFDGDGREAPRSYYESQRIEHPMPYIGYEDDSKKQSFEALEQIFLDDIMRLSKEQTDAEDAESARHRERIKAINAQYVDKLAALGAQYASRREEFLSQARKQQYQQHFAMEQYPNDPRGTAPAVEVEPHRAYHYENYREQTRVHRNARDHGYEPKLPYPRGRSYGTGSRYH